MSLPLSFDWDRLRARLSAPGGSAPPDAIAARIQSDDAADLLDRPLTPAAVLVGIVPAADGPAVLLTKRTSHLKAHAGQVAFPGGRIEPSDASPEAAALREAEEEVGLSPTAVETLGRLPDYVTGTGFRVCPVLGLIAPGQVYRPNPDEVDAVFTLPLSTVLDPTAPERRHAPFRGKRREFWVWPHEEHYIWGATAAILVHLAHRLRAAPLDAAAD